MFSWRNTCPIAGMLAAVSLCGISAYAATAQSAKDVPPPPPIAQKTTPVKVKSAAKTATTPSVKAKTTAPVTAKPPRPDVLAMVNGTPITKSQMNATLSGWFGSVTMDEMVDSLVFKQAALKSGVTVTDAEVNAKIDEFVKSMPSKDAFINMVHQRGYTLERIKNEQRVRLLVEKAVKKTIVVTDDDLKQVKASHILIRVQPPKDNGNEAERKASEDAAKDKAQKIYEEAKAPGADFAALAKAYSEDSTKDNGGDLGFFGHGQMVGEFEAAAFALKVNEISEPVRSQFGYHIIKVTGIKTVKDMTPAEAAKLRDSITTERMNSAMSDWMTKAKADAKIQRFDKYPD